MKITIVAFDFDGTITRKNSLYEFLKHTHGFFQIAIHLLLVFPYLILYKTGVISNGKAKQKLFSEFYKNWSIEKFNHFCTSFQPVVDAFIRPDVFRTLKKHLADNHKVIIVSASIENWIIPWAEKEHVETVIATQIEVDQQGKLTGQFLSKNCYGKEKVRRLLQMFPERDTYTLIVYGDSKGDLEMMNMADENHLFR